MTKFDPFAVKLKNENIRDSQVPHFTERRLLGDYCLFSDKFGPLETSISSKTIHFFKIIFIFILALILFRVSWLQIFQGEKLLRVAEGNRIKIERIKAERGLIYDRFGSVLAENAPNFSLILNPLQLPKDQKDREKVWNQLSEILELDQIELDQLESDQISNTNIELNIKELSELRRIQEIIQTPIKKLTKKEVLINNLDYQKALKIELKQNQLQGLILVLNPKRNYLVPEAFAHVLGYVGLISPEEMKSNQDYFLSDFIGKTALELEYEEIMRGKEGQRLIETDSRGRFQRIVEQRAMQPGQDLILTIDKDLQIKSNQVLEKYIRSTGSRAGAIIALDPRNGKILSLVNQPSFNSNLFVFGGNQKYQDLLDDPAKPLFYRAISGQYPSGSIIKPLIALAGLEEELINERTIIHSTGGIQVSRWFFPDWKDGGHGATNIQKAIAESVNTFFYYLGGGYADFEGLGVAKINRYGKLFGLGQITGIDSLGEAKGFLPTKSWKETVKQEPWYIGDTYHLAIGQGDLLVTPIQIANYTAAIANNGILFQPRLVQETGLFNQSKVLTKTKIIRANHFNPQNINLVKQGMRMAVVEGSAIRLKSLPVEIAGKTGTAQVAGKRSHAWFTCFAPYNNPEIVLTILVENGGGGSAVAVPIAYEILDWWSKNRFNLTE